MTNAEKLTLAKHACHIRMGVIEGTHSAKCGHPGGSLDIAEVLSYLYFVDMNIDPKEPKKPDRDRFVLSKGHAAPALYATLAESGFFPVENLLLDNLLLVDIYNRAKKLHIDADVRRAVMILELSQEKDHSSMENVKSFFGGKSKDFITAVDEKSIIIVKELEEGESYADLDKLSHAILDTLGLNQNEETHIAYGTIVNELKEVSRSYKEARMALDVGKIFFGDKDVIAYSSLGIGRLIYQLPIPLCKMFIKEIFENKSPDDFDEETLVTIDKFFENSLNVSETSRQLYIHRNTLVYRLDKLQKSTGLDLRVFEDAITFKIALMVVRYMKYMETLEY